MISCTFLLRKRSDMRLKNSAPGTDANATRAEEKPMATPSKPRSCCRNEGSQVTIMLVAVAGGEVHCVGGDHAQAEQAAGLAVLFGLGSRRRSGLADGRRGLRL